MSQQKNRVQVENQIDAAITIGEQPKAPRNGIGLILPTSARSRTLYDKNGITAAGKYYYDKTGIHLLPRVENLTTNRIQQEKAGVNI